uniref:tRNA(Phe) (4-demethylwyosine(37)-C(7)) aminocarboxypropyltransferase n=1 Tax=Calcidiscus leptoporus TaxID=127549 RepID=A0A7S0JKT7_9EUKA
MLWPEGCGGWTTLRENGLSYSLDVTKSMYSSGNGTEKMRVGRFACSGETVVDLYAGIGYFTLPYLVHAAAAHVHACEWDADTLIALKHNLKANAVDARCTVHEGDNKASLAAFAGSAHRVNLGLIPSSEAGWPVALAALKPSGGWLHVHENVGSASGEEEAWCGHLLATLSQHAGTLGCRWQFRVEHVEHVKWYAPKVRHIVADIFVTPCPSVTSVGM